MFPGGAANQPKHSLHGTFFWLWPSSLRLRNFQSTECYPFFRKRTVCFILLSLWTHTSPSKFILLAALVFTLSARWCFSRNRCFSAPATGLAVLHHVVHCFIVIWVSGSLFSWSCRPKWKNCDRIVGIQKWDRKQVWLKIASFFFPTINRGAVICLLHFTSRLDFIRL